MLSEKLSEVQRNDQIMLKASIDKLRLLLIYYLSSESIKIEDINELAKILSENYPNLCFDSLNYLKLKQTSHSTKEERRSGFSNLFTSNN